MIKNILFSLLLFLASYKATNGKKENEVSQTNNKNVNFSKKYNYTREKLNCNSDNSPTSCVGKNIKIGFSFDNEPNKISITYSGLDKDFLLDDIFEGINHNSHLFKSDKKTILIIELVYEMGSKYIFFDLSKNYISIIGSFLQEDLIDDKDNYVKSDISITQSSNILDIKIGDSKTFGNHTLDLSKSKKI